MDYEKYFTLSKSEIKQIEGSLIDNIEGFPMQNIKKKQNS